MSDNEESIRHLLNVMLCRRHEWEVMDRTELRQERFDAEMRFEKRDKQAIEFLEKFDMEAIESLRKRDMQAIEFLRKIQNTTNGDQS